MPIVNLVPTTQTVEDALADRMPRIRAKLREVIQVVSGFPEDDIKISLMSCPYRDADPTMADFIIYADTCPNEELEAKANELCNMVALTVIDMGFLAEAEIWPRFLPGPWCLVKDREIIDSVDHPRK